jgi:ABC-type lipoprotein export system ATPase subunit
VFAVGILAVVLLRHSLAPATGAAAVGLMVFVAVVRRHLRWEDRRALTERILVVVDESLHACTMRDRPARAWQRPRNPEQASMVLPEVLEAGATWPLTDQERDDLDLYGPPVGLFGLLNRTSTDLGARRLRDLLDSPCLSREHIQQRQRSVRWLDRHNEQRLTMMANVALLRGRSGHLDTLVRLLHAVERLPRSVVSRAIRIWSVFSGLLFIYAVMQVAGGQYEWARAVVALLVVNGLILLLLSPVFRLLNRSVSPWARLRSTLIDFLAIAQHAAEDLPDETQLSVLKEQFRRIVAEARIPSLCAWLEWAGLHGIVRGLLNTFIFLDLHIAEAVLARVAPNRDVLLHGLSAMAELEALCSLACFSAEQPVACYPQPANETSLLIEDGRHPLIPEQDVTPNDVRLTPETRTWVITGPNAAGKSTFLRMVGVNVLLAQVGAAVAAREMTWSPVRLITDVRIRDDLAKHESYFLSEVRRLRRLVLDAESRTPALGLIDEPFRGTNSQERTAAGIALLEHLTASRNLFLIATHEETLAQIAANAAAAQNHHFQEHLHEGGITFDYLLRPGPANTRTALRILEQEGYPGSLLDRARGLMTGGAETARSD